MLRIIRGLDYGKERAPKGAEYHNYVKLTEFLQQTAENHKTFVRYLPTLDLFVIVSLLDSQHAVIDRQEYPRTRIVGTPHYG